MEKVNTVPRMRMMNKKQISTRMNLLKGEKFRASLFRLECFLFTKYMKVEMKM